MKKITKDNLFKPNPTRGETKHETTDEAARAIIESEAGKRERKTERLREARLAKEAEADAEAKSKARKKGGTSVKLRNPKGNP
jgi:hypothetical protein